MRRGVVIGGLAALLLALVAANLSLGAAPVPLRALLALGEAPPAGSEEATHRAILLLIRLPRICLGLLVGAALSVGGALLQGLFRNPLADPGLLGVSGGAALGAALVQVLGGERLTIGLPAFVQSAPLAVAAFAGALLAAVLVRGLGSRGDQTSGSTLLLAGIAVNAGSFSLLSLLIWVADDADLRAITSWSMGSLGGATGPVLLGVGPLLLLCLLLSSRLTRSLDALLLGEAEASALGIDPAHLRRWILALSALLVGGAVAVSGAIGFVGLGVLTALFGTPLFVVLLRRVMP